MSKAERPHRRLSLTSPSAPAPAETPQVEPESPSYALHKMEPSPTPAPAATPSKLMVYFEPTEADLLDNLWFQAKKRRPRLSKSDVMRAALLLLNDHPEQLDSVLSRLHTSTESRQRASRKG